jgi:protein-S-isoprenylcysteine O-methyltransferase Ste14
VRSQWLHGTYQDGIIMQNQNDSPGVYIPPPLIYVAIFLAALFVQKEVPIHDALFHLQIARVVGVTLLVIALFFIATSMQKFVKSKNTLMLIRPASSLQTSGIYHVSRNPMYLGLAIVYLGLTCLLGNWWHIILFPILLMIIQGYIISREEKYLMRRFGQEYVNYRSKVRRWL